MIESVMPTGVASSVMKDHPTEKFGLIPTMELALRENHGAVQIYLNDAFCTTEYLEQLLPLIAQFKGTIILHLPDRGALHETHLAAATTIVSGFLDKDIRVLIHYEEGMVAEDVPAILDKKVGLENSKTGVFDPIHVLEALRLARSMGTFFVFDHGRIMYGSAYSADLLYQWIQAVIEELDAENDIMHSADKTSWDLRYRESSTHLGDVDGVGYSLVAALRNFHLDGGVIIFEQENLDQALRSIATVIED